VLQTQPQQHKTQTTQKEMEREKPKKRGKKIEKEEDLSSITLT
jgi:hypothetical protein